MAGIYKCAAAAVNNCGAQFLKLGCWFQGAGACERKLYLCVVAGCVQKQSGVVLFSCKSDAGDCCVFSTLGAGVVFLLVVPGTLVGAAVVFGSFGIFCTCLNCVAMSSNKFWTGFLPVGWALSWAVDLIR